MTKKLINKIISVLLLFIFSNSSAKTSISEQEVFDTGIKAYIYAYPLVMTEVTKENTIKPPFGKLWTNTLINFTDFPTDTFTTIVRPNLDTLYSFAWLDLEREPIVLSVPDTHGRYYLMELMDAWTNVFASLGKRTTGTTARDFIIVGPFWKGRLPKQHTIIRSPTNSVWVLGRTQTNGKKDYDFVHKIQSGYHLTPLSEWQKNKRIKPHNFSLRIKRAKPVPADIVDHMNAKTFYTQFVSSLKNNPPASADSFIVSLLKRIGITQDTNFSNPEYTEKYWGSLDKAMAAAKKKIAAKKDSLQTNNGWLTLLNIGKYGTSYATRAMIALLGIGANLPQDAVYPATFVDSQNQPLVGSNNYRMHFNKEQLPPVRAFWSIALYNNKGFLVKNPISRYALGDRDPLIYNKDGSLDIYIQHTSPSKDKEVNWLPAPAGNFNLCIRLYWPERQVLNGQWNPPPVKKIS